MSVGPEVRLARAEDVAKVFALERRVPEAPHWELSDYASIPGQERAEGLRRRLFVAEDGSGLVGFAVGKIIGSGVDALAELESVVVDKDSRRRGVGRRLCEAVLEWCESEGAASVELEVRSLNHAAQAVYRRIGFVEEGRRRRYYRDPDDDALLMRFRVAPVGNKGT
ncbi:GNAT family N-acetyltransferase [Edaphobacter sp. HDX4]|uniref:GNAT family N-acetyltransferase n=1 Tax=Edaphobacter sp. HDX4 TaxID=2794064 RepID=UPI002FE57E8B